MWVTRQCGRQGESSCSAFLVAILAAYDFRGGAQEGQGRFPTSLRLARELNRPRELGLFSLAALLEPPPNTLPTPFPPDLPYRPPQSCPRSPSSTW